MVDWYFGFIEVSYNSDTASIIDESVRNMGRWKAKSCKIAVITLKDDGVLGCPRNKNFLGLSALRNVLVGFLVSLNTIMYDVKDCLSCFILYLH